MVVVDRKYTGAAAKAVLQTAMTASSPTGGGTISVDDDSGWPTGGKFELTIDRGEANEEHILIASRSGTTFTISQRGYDGSTASSHTSGLAFVEHYLSGTTMQTLTDHADDVEAAPHASKLPVGTTAGHDVEARHTFGAALGTPVTPTALTPDIAGAAGTGNNPAREDHAHNVPAGAPVSVGTANAEGAGTSFARDTHVHDLANALGTTPTAIAPDDTQAGGSALTASKNDHRHAITTGTPAALTQTATSAESAGTGFARDVHVHATSALPWGIVARQTLTTANGPHSANATTDFALTNVSTNVLRLYKVVLNTEYVISGAFSAEFDLNLHVDTVAHQKMAALRETTNAARHTLHVEYLWEPSTGTHDLDLRLVETDDGASITFDAAAAARRQFWVEDIGLR